MNIELTYDDIKNLAKNIGGRLNDEYSDIQPDVLTFTKGGTFATSFISNYLSWKPNIVSITDVSVGIDMVDTSLGYVLVEDILDTGKTIQSLDDSVISKSIYDRYFLVTKNSKDRIYTPLHYSTAKTFETENWIVFPWEIL